MTFTAEQLQLFAAAKLLLDRLDSITTEEFSKGGEKFEREMLRKVIGNFQVVLG